MREPIVVRRVEWETEYGRDRLNVWKTSGTPADCVRIALFELLRDDLPDLVVSGINNGWNAGTDCHYSGTVGAAMEAYFQDLPADCRFNAAFLAQPQPACGAVCAAHGRAGAGARQSARSALEPEPARLRRGRGAGVRRGDDGARAIYRHVRQAGTVRKSRRVPGPRGELVPEKFAEGSDLYWLWRNYATITAFDWNWTKPNRCGFILQD